MSKFCQNCGTELEDDALFCVNCGAKEEAEVPAPEAKNDVVANVKETVDNIVEKVKADPKLLAFAGGAVVVVLVLIILLANIFGGGWKKAIDNVMDVSFKGKVNKIEKLAPEEYWEYLEEESDMDLEDLKDSYEDKFEDSMDELEDEYGKNVRISYKIEDKDKISDKDMEKIADGLKEKYDIKKKSVKKGYEVDVELKIKGSEDDDEDDASLNVVKIGSKWYVISFYEYNDEAYVNFVTGF